MQKLFFFGGSSLPGDHTIKLETSIKASKVISSCTSELISLNNFNSSSKEPFLHRLKEKTLMRKLGLRK